jgi:transcriptional regulator with XRE-family HTH domain
MSIFSERLKGLRLKQNRTQQEIADALEVTRIAYSNWENGKREPSFDNVKALAELLETSTDYLFGQSENPNSIFIKVNEIKTVFPELYLSLEKKFAESANTGGLDLSKQPVDQIISGGRFLVSDEEKQKLEDYRKIHESSEE